MSPATSGAPAARALAAAAAYTSATVASVLASFRRLALKVLVVMQSAPASTYWRWMATMASGCVRFSRSGTSWMVWRPAA